MAYDDIEREVPMMRRFTLPALTLLLASLCAAPLLANPIVQWSLRDTPLGSPDGIWNDQWSGGFVNPPGELLFWDPPPMDQPCGDDEGAASIARIGAGEFALLAYSDPVYGGTQAGGYGNAVLFLRQTCWEVSTVVVSVYKVDADGGNPVLLASDAQSVAVDSWPPTEFFFEFENVPVTPMDDGRFLLEISTEDGACTDIVWDCLDFNCWVTLPEEGNPPEATAWGKVKALYR
jgi:hypothetical protein